MKTTRFYIVAVEDKQTREYKVSQEAYFNYKDAKQFIQSRIDKPKEINLFLFESEKHKYIINDVLAHEGGK